MHLKMIVRVVMNQMMKTCHCFLPAQPRFEWTGGDTDVTRDIPLMSRHSKYSCTELGCKHCVYI